jgi:diketogulonate reductase-like aldo/keto reductase
LQTKFTPLDGHDPRRVPYDPRAPLDQQVAQSFEVSLMNLRTEYVDALVLHSPLPDFGQLLVVWRALERIADAGGARALGISNCYDEKVLSALYAAARVKPALVQNRFHAATGYDLGIRRFCREREIVYQSFWTLTANAALLNDQVVRALAARHERSSVQVLFRYLTQSGVVPLTGTTSSAHMREDLAIFEFELEAPERAAIDRLIIAAGRAD